MLLRCRIRFNGPICFSAFESRLALNLHFKIWNQLSSTSPINSAFGKTARLCFLITSAAVVFFILFFTATDASAQSVERQFAAYALELRDLGVAGDEQFSDFVRTMPGSRIVDEKVLHPLWRSSISNTIVKLGRLRSDSPVSMYYDPLLDIAVLAYWVRENDALRIASARALPAERMSDSKTQASPTPEWLSSDKSTIEALVSVTERRLSAFEQMHPAQSIEAAKNTTTFASAAGDMRMVLLRLIQNAERQSKWTAPDYAWLESLLSLVEELLALQDVYLLIANAPDTDRETASALTELPSQYIADLALDMVLEYDEQRLLIGSSVQDGDTYVIVLCTLSAESCELRKLALVSLLE